MMYFQRLFIFLLLLTFVAVAHAQEFDSTWVVAEDYPEMDTTEVEEGPALVNPDQLPGAENYKQENIAKKKLNTTDWEKVVGDQRFEEKEKKEFEEKKQKPQIVWDSNLLRTISFIILILIVLALVFVVLRNMRLDSKVKKSTLLVQEIEEVDDIEKLNTEDMMAQALQAKDYRLAIRLAYLDLLKVLHENKVIVWKKDKTNHDYLSELKSEKFASTVKSITLNYERIWYGEREADEAFYLTIRQECQQVYGELNKKDS